MNYINEINGKFTNFFQPIWDKIVHFLSKGEDYYLLYGVIGVILIILVLLGLFSFLKKAPKFFVFLIIILGAVVAIWYFLILKK